MFKLNLSKKLRNLLYSFKESLYKEFHPGSHS
jgi:4'-phosphopantetheinyl transferase EntD